MSPKLNAIPLPQVHLLPGLFANRFEMNKRYVMSLRNQSLLQNHLIEARLYAPKFTCWDTVGGQDRLEDMHWGWESPTCQVRGHFLGHWLSAASRIAAMTGDGEVKAKAEAIVAGLARCQEANGGEWVGPIPESYLDWTAKGRATWAPQYMLHKTMMGLLDAFIWLGSEQALDIVQNSARWFHRWTAQFSREQMDDLLDVETGGMLELWADLYAITGKDEYLDLLRRYDRPRLFEPLLAGEDALTNRHANTTIPEAHGAARAYEVTGEERWRRVAEAYWKCAVTDRGTFCTGGQTSGEIWTPPFEFAARLGAKNQEHCTVYNMIRLASYLLRWTGDPVYADYVERNLYNGILAQQNPQTGMVTYFLPLEPGARKVWGTPTHDFWCCHATLVQAHTLYPACAYHEDDAGIYVSQYIPSELKTKISGAGVTVRQSFDHEPSSIHRPDRWAIQLEVECERPVEFTLSLRVPAWVNRSAAITVNGESGPAASPGFCSIRRTWSRDAVRIELPKSLTACPLPDEPNTVAFMDGPIVLAGLCDEQHTLHGDPADPRTMLAPDNEREWDTWLSGYRAINQERSLRFKPLYEVADERYTVYFPVRR